MALAGLHREYPNKVVHALESDDDVAPPRELTPVFYGCYDWHSAVHSHWCLVRALRTAGTSDAAWRTALETSFREHALAREHAYLEARPGFERPYGLAWLLELCAELSSFDDDDAARWAALLGPLERLAAARLCRYAAELPAPVRSGEHAQTAFALGLALDWAERAANRAARDELSRNVRRLYAADRDGPLHLEPSGYDFLSPCLAEADVMRRVLAPSDFSGWLDRWLPGLASSGLVPVSCPDPSDGKLAHLDGLNLSRAWMLRGIAEGLPEGDARIAPLETLARQHLDAALAAIDGAHYAGSHWLGSFAVYALTSRAARRGSSG